MCRGTWEYGEEINKLQTPMIQNTIRNHKKKIYYAVIAVVFVALAIFMLPSVQQIGQSVTLGTFTANVAMAFGGDGKNDGPGGGEGGGCCGGSYVDESSTPAPDPVSTTSADPIVIPPLLQETPIDFCPNISGDQSAIPAGMVIDANGNCVTPVVTPLIIPPTDLCPNIAGAQSAIPTGMIVDGVGNCVTPVVTPLIIPPTDLCPNISGDQSAIPAGMVIDASGNCVTPSGGGGGGGGGRSGGSSAPRCIAFTASNGSISPGDAVTLTWKTLRGTRLEIDHEVLSIKDTDQVKEGSVIVRPIQDTTYTLKVLRGNRDDICTISVKVTQGITIASSRELAFATLPYTGFDAGPFLTSVFYTLLTLWSLAVAYVIVVKRGSVFGVSLPKSSVVAHGPGSMIPHKEYAQHNASHQTIVEVHEPAVFAHASVVNREAPLNLPTAPAFSHIVASWKTVASPEVPTTNTEEDLEKIAHAHNVLLSSDALRVLVDHSKVHAERATLLNEMIVRAKVLYARQDGWIVLNRERVLVLFTEVASTQNTKVNVLPEITAPTETVGAHTLAEALVSGNTARAYELLGDEPIEAIADAAEMLDAVVRARHGLTEASDILVRASVHISDEKLKTAVVALVSVIDGTYDDQNTAVRLAVIKALKAIA